MYQNASEDERRMMAEALLVASGIVPNTDTLNLKDTRIALTEEGFIKVDEYLQTTVSGIYAMGDCTGKYFYRHTVNFEGEYLFRTVFEQRDAAPIQYPHSARHFYSSSSCQCGEN